MMVQKCPACNYCLSYFGIVDTDHFIRSFHKHNVGVNCILPIQRDRFRQQGVAIKAIKRIKAGELQRAVMKRWRR